MLLSTYHLPTYLAYLTGLHFAMQDVLKFKEDENEEFPHLPKIRQEEELVTDFDRSIDFYGGRRVQKSSQVSFYGRGKECCGAHHILCVCNMTISWQQSHSNSGSFSEWANFPSFGKVTETQPQQQQPIADFADFSTVVEPNPIDSSSLPPSNSSNLPCTISSDGECTKEPIEDETKMTSALRTVPFTAKEVLADPIDQTEECIGIKAKTL